MLEHYQQRVNGLMEKIRYCNLNEQAIDMLDDLEMALQDLEGETNRIVEEIPVETKVKKVA